MSKGKKRNPDAMQVDTQEEMLSLSLDELIKQRKQAQKQEKKVEVQKQVAKQARQDIVDKRRGIVASKPDLRTIIPKSDLKSQKSTRSKQPVKQQGNNKQGNQPAKQSNQQKKPIEKSIVPKPLKPLKPISEINITIINDTVKQHQPFHTPLSMQPISQPPMHSFLPLEHRPMFQERPTFQDRSLPQYELPVRRQSQETGVLSSRFAQLRDAVREQPLYNEYGNGVLAGVYNAPVLRKL